MSYETGSPTWTWPEWRKAPAGLRVKHNRSGATGTYLKPSKSRNNGAKIHWDDRGFGVRETYVISPARDLTPIRVSAWELIGFDGNLNSICDSNGNWGPDRPAGVRIKGGRSLYEAVIYYDNTPGDSVKLSRLDARDGIRQINRWVAPDTELEIVELQHA